MIFMDVFQDNGGHGYTILQSLYDIVERCNIVQDRKNAGAILAVERTSVNKHAIYGCFIPYTWDR